MFSFLLVTFTQSSVCRFQRSENNLSSVVEFSFISSDPTQIKQSIWKNTDGRGTLYQFKRLEYPVKVNSQRNVKEKWLTNFYYYYIIPISINI